jgi:transposase-like protein
VDGDDLPPEKVIGMLREAEVALSQGMTVGQVCRQLSISEQTYYRWRKQYGGMKISQAKRMKDMERENTRLKKAVADLTSALTSSFDFTTKSVHTRLLTI